MKTCNRKILELFYNAKHTGRISKPDAIGRVGEDDDGLVIELTWRVVGGVIADAKFRAFANPNAIAITSLMIDNIIGKSIDDALLINEDIIIDNLGEFLPEYLEAYDMVREAMHEAYNNYLKRENRKVEKVDEITYEQYIANQQLVEDEFEDVEFDFMKVQRQLQSENISTEKRGRGRPRKIVDESQVVEVGEKRGRGRPRKEVDPNLVVEIGEKRGRGRPRKIVDETEIVEVGEKRGRGRPKKEIKFSLPSDLDDVIGDEEVEQLINGNSNKHTEVEIEPVIVENKKVASTSILDEDEDTFGADYDLFKSNIRNILSGKEVNNHEYNRNVATKVEAITTEKTKEQLDDEDNIAEHKRGRGRTRNEVDETEEVEVDEKRGRGRPEKIVIEQVEPQQSTETAKPRVEPINSLTRSLTPNSLPSHSSQDIVFASKNVTTTNVNINVTKITTSVEDNKTLSDDYSHNASISQHKVEINTPYFAKDDEIDLDDDEINNNLLDDYDDNYKNKYENETDNDYDEDTDEDIDASHIKDEAPTGGLEDLLKALLDD
ncbi:MAG: iron-sulfur cluster assembly scaffold protein [Clostridia bacterium]